MTALNDPERHPDGGSETAHGLSGHESQRDTTPRIFVATWNGEVAVVEARTGRECWVRHTQRELGTLAMDGETAYFATGSSLASIKRLVAARDLDPVQRQDLIARADTPALLEARRAGDGALLWSAMHPKIKGRLHVEAESGVVVAANPRHFEADIPPIQAFDGVSGNLLWHIEGKTIQSSTDQLIAVRGGRVFARLGNHLDETATALDLHTGSPLWQHTWHNPWIFSPNGVLIGERPSMSDFILIDARDGSELAHIPLQGLPQVLTDDGIVYGTMDFGPYEEHIAAIDARTGKRLWQTQTATGVSLGYDRGILYYAHVHLEQRYAEVGALDAATGARLWRWHSPTNLAELLRLWGPRRIPGMLWDSTEKSVANMAAIVGQPWFRLRAPRWSPRTGPQPRMPPAMRLRNIREGVAQIVVWPLWHEVAQGHWRHPWQLHDGMHLGWPVARWDIVFLGTWLGLFALDAADGHLLWHALPTLDLSSVEPALAP